jgi:hypothetical protein
MGNRCRWVSNNIIGERKGQALIDSCINIAWQISSLFCFAEKPKTNKGGQVAPTASGDLSKFK